MSCDMWFGTKDFSRFIKTPQSGADVSPQAWSSNGTLLNGQGYALGSFGSHKEYSFAWGDSAARENAQLMKSFFDGSFGRGKLYFQDPLTLNTNVLPARWADPSITANFEGPSLVPGVDPITVSASPSGSAQTPVKSAQYNLNSVSPVPASFTPQYENLFTNPRLVGDGTYATVAENLFTNPNLVGDGTWAEVRRNLVSRPITTAPGNYPFSTQGGANWGGTVPTRSIASSTGAPSGSSDVIQFLSSVAQTTVPGTDLCSTGGFAVASGETYTASYYCKPSDVMSVRCQIQWLTSGGVSAGVSTVLDITLPANVWTRVSVTGVAPATAVSARLDLDSHNANVLPSGFTLLFDAAMLEKSSTLSPYFDGSTVGDQVQPEDFRTRWLGTPNASESVLEIEQVRGLTVSNCVAGVSTKAGGAAVRLIPLSNSTTSFASFPISSAARASGTVVATSHLDAPLPSPYDRRRGSADVSSPQTDGPIRDNTAGAAALRQIFSAQITSALARMWHGGAQGSGDIWWTDIGLFAGTYTGEAFSGADDPEVTGFTQPEDFRIRWSGAVDNSTSLLEIERVAGLSQVGALVGVSTKDGKPAARLIPTGSSAASAARFNVPPVAQSGGTLIGTLHINTPLKGSLEARSRTLMVEAPEQKSTPSPNVPGVYPQRLVYGALTGTFRAVLFNGGTQGSGDVWWTDIGLFAGTYDGDYFDGSSGSVTVGGNTLETRWTGAVDNSTSQAGSWVAATSPNLSDDNALFIPVPDGMQLNLGAFHSFTGTAGVFVTPATLGGDVTSSITRLAPLTSGLFNTVISKQPGSIGVYLWLGKLTADNASLTVNAIHARLSPVGKSPTGPQHWVGGQGNEGVRFAGPPTYINNTGVNGGQVGYAATFIESVL